MALTAALLIGILAGIIIGIGYVAVGTHVMVDEDNDKR